MQYPVLIFLAATALGALIWTIYKMSELKHLFLQRIISNKIIDQSCFSTLAVRKLAKYILAQKKTKRRQLLRNISENRFDELIKRIDRSDLKAELRLMMTGKTTAGIKNDGLYILMRAERMIKQNDYNRAAVLLKQADNPKGKALQAMKRLLNSRMALFAGDMLGASEDAAVALKTFQKENMLYEEAQTYFTLGTLYRVSGIFDSADFMLRAALKLFKAANSKLMTAEVLGNLGLLTSVQQRFDEAADYLAKAKTILQEAEPSPLSGFITCQQAMLELLQDRPEQAEKLVKELAESALTAAEQAFATEILSRVAYATGNLSKSADLAEKAATIYRKENNYAAVFECMYLQAEALAKSEQTEEAEILLRELIAKESLHKSCFHIANALTFLGLILLQKGEAERAKAIFNQALGQEMYNDRRAGAAIDYANLAAAEKRCGHLHEARDNLMKALAYAKDADDELYNRLKNALN